MYLNPQFCPFERQAIYAPLPLFPPLPFSNSLGGRRPSHLAFHRPARDRAARNAASRAALRPIRSQLPRSARFQQIADVMCIVICQRYRILLMDRVHGHFHPLCRSGHSENQFGIRGCVTYSAGRFRVHCATATLITANRENNGKDDIHVVGAKVYEGAVHPCRGNRHDNH
jgi:hypothetical protein